MMSCSVQSGKGMSPTGCLKAAPLLRRVLLAIPGIAPLVFFGGCSIAHPPTAALRDAELEIRAADEAKAGEFASADLQKARDKVTRAKQALAAEHYDEARRFAERARLDAEVAEAKAEARFMRRVADQILRKTRVPPTQNEMESRKSITTSPSK